MPPVGRARRLRRVLTSIAMPGIELTTVSASAPAASQACATSTTRAGAILTRSGRPVTGLHAATTSAAAEGVDPIAAPPAEMLGQEMLISKPAPQGASSSKSSSASTNSRTLCPATWQMTAQPREERSRR